ncbi:MAG: DUF3011 domain-containing protein [Gloeomargarita sp. SKYBB_i_bin120]|nr:DUF3011 domain-containing protein [Gloeomargarita sp. SKYG98]MCS7291362.1 DUF3011 domain-containing protein [Gloeomargarita sp. SKYB120]MDW8176921.1 DUF3011 domain-containing protein [Gloeomargarita sp. SKYBB_i_bin120]
MRGWSWLVAVGLVSVTVQVGAIDARPSRATTGQTQQRLTCESINGRYKTCPVDARGGVRLERQLSNARCIENRTWGVNDRGIWVDKGCRGVFVVTAGPVTMTCRSVNFKYQFCRVNTQGGVRLQRQLSHSPCVQGRTWGYDDQGVWVDRGCAAAFLIGAGSGDTVWPPVVEQVVRCESVNNQRVVCPVATHGVTVTLEQQLSRAPCVQNQTWGVDRQGIWVASGCRGNFRIRGFPTGSVGPSVVCRSCPVATRQEVLKPDLGC